MPYNVASFSAQDFENCRQYAKALIAFVNGTGPNPARMPEGYREVYLIKVPGAPLPEHFNNIINQRRAESAERLAQDNTGLMQAMRSMMDMHGDLVRQVLASRLEREIHELNRPVMGFARRQPRPVFRMDRGAITASIRPSFNHAHAGRSLVDRIKHRSNAGASAGVQGPRRRRVRRNRRNRKQRRDDSMDTDCSEASSSGLITIVEELELSKESDVLVDVKESDDLINLMETDNEWEDNGMNADMTNFGN
ncbi:hypothetical protein B0H14DRAFT_2588119 [Mycena olivaceomarginata]|nr:hypothetical protein B0H14DRAFT_2588119 [Mycena olivaceomarginata]